MSEYSSRMAEAQTAQEADLTTDCSSELSGAEKKQTANDRKGHEPASSQSVSSLLDAAQYVEAVMSSQQIAAVLRTPVAANSSRKRHLSLPAVGESEVKKIIVESSGTTEGREVEETSENDRTLRNVVRARRNLLGNKDKDSESKSKSANSSNDTNRILKAMEDLRSGLEHKMDEISKTNNEKFEVMKNEMKNEIEKIRNDFNKRIEGLEKKVETKVSKTLDKNIDDKVKVLKNNIDKEMEKIKSSNDKIVKSVKKVEETALPTLKEELGDEMDELNRRMKNLEEKVGSNRKEEEGCSQSDKLKRCIIVKQLEERENENINDRVNSLIYNGLKLDNIKVESATRKPTKSDTKPGIMVAVCKSMKDKDSIMQRKRDLKRSRRYENVYIEHHMPPEQRRLNSNLRTIVNTIGNDRLWRRGSRVLQAENSRDNARPRSYEQSSRSYDYTRRDSYIDKRNNDHNYERNRYERRDSDSSYYRSDRNSQGYRPSSGHNFSNRR